MSDTKPAKPASDAAEIARKLREDCIGMEDCKPGNAHEFCFTCQAADTIEALQRENERLAKIEQRAQDLLAVALSDSQSNEGLISVDASEKCEWLTFILEGDQLQGGSDNAV